jgi:hypothetical protein
MRKRGYKDYSDKVYSFSPKERLKYWRTKDNIVVKTSDMTTSHLENCLKLMDRKGYTKLKLLTTGHRSLAVRKILEQELRKRKNELDRKNKNKDFN